MSRSHRVWSDVNADNYTTSKSFGGEFTQHIAVGSSASYSNAFATVAVDEVALRNEFGKVTDWSVFRLWIDGTLDKRALFNSKSKAFKHIALDDVATEVIAGLES